MFYLAHQRHSVLRYINVLLTYLLKLLSFITPKGTPETHRSQSMPIYLSLTSSPWTVMLSCHLGDFPGELSVRRRKCLGNSL